VKNRSEKIVCTDSDIYASSVHLRPTKKNGGIMNMFCVQAKYLGHDIIDFSQLALSEMYAYQ